MLRTVIVDDESAALQTLEYMLRKYSNKIRIIGSATDSQQAIELINHLKPDVLFLDVKMPGLDGFQLFEKLDHRTFTLVFCTGSGEFGLKALKCNAIDYVLKPIDSAELEKTVERIERSHNSRLTSYEAVLQEMETMRRVQILRIPLPTADHIEYAHPSDIVYIEADGKHVRVVMANGDVIQVSRGLKEYETLLCQRPLKFNRLHNSYIVNLYYVTQYLKEDGGYVVIRNRRIPVSKQRRMEVMAELAVPA